MLTKRSSRLIAAALSTAAVSLAIAPLTDAQARGWSRHHNSAKAAKRSNDASTRHASGYGRHAKGAPVARPVAPIVQKAASVAAVPPATGGDQALVGIAAGGVTSTSARVASDLSAVLDGADLRVLPLMTRSSLADATALAQADKADLVFLHADVIDGLPEGQRDATTKRLAYVARLYNDEVHVVASRAVKDIHDLAGKAVNVGPEGSANAQTAELIFDRLGILPRYLHLDQPTALTKLAGGELAADVLVSGRPVKALQDFAGDGRFQLLPIPYETSLQDIYLPAKLDATDYGNLMPPGGAIDTLSVPVVLATIDAPAGSPRAARVGTFTRALFERFDALRDPSHHPKWRDVNLAASVTNWNRFAGAQDAIDKSTARSVAIDKRPERPSDIGVSR